MILRRSDHNSFIIPSRHLSVQAIAGTFHLYYYLAAFPLLLFDTSSHLSLRHRTLSMSEFRTLFFCLSAIEVFMTMLNDELDAIRGNVVTARKGALLELAVAATVTLGIAIVCTYNSVPGWNHLLFISAPLLFGVCASAYIVLRPSGTTAYNFGPQETLRRARRALYLLYHRTFRKFMVSMAVVVVYALLLTDNAASPGPAFLCLLATIAYGYLVCLDILTATQTLWLCDAGGSVDE
ncbi:MAG: hypothetical protein U0136_14005 [Bdellovibrionota bacterium]